MLTLTQRFPADPAITPHLTLSLTAEERSRSRRKFMSDEGQPLALQLPRGTVLYHGDLLKAENAAEFWVKVIAKSEPVLTVTAHHSLDLLRAAYHLGNRHVPLEVTPGYLRLSPDPVLQAMLEHLGVQVVEEAAPFQPEVGAYSHHSAHSHSHSE